jgi:uncharacterized membrane protein
VKDIQLLTVLVDSGELSDDEDKVFRSMLSQIDRDARQPKTLSKKQREWAESVYHKLGLDRDAPSENLYSTGQVKKPIGPLPVMGWEKFPKALKPANRR